MSRDTEATRVTPESVRRAEIREEQRKVFHDYLARHDINPVTAGDWEAAFFDYFRQQPDGKIKGHRADSRTFDALKEGEEAITAIMVRYVTARESGSPQSVDECCRALDFDPERIRYLRRTHPELNELYERLKSGEGISYW